MSVNSLVHSLIIAEFAVNRIRIERQLLVFPRIFFACLRKKLYRSIVVMLKLRSINCYQSYSSHSPLVI